MAAAGNAYMAGLSACGLVHQCPWCSAKIRAGRTAEILQCTAAVAAMGGAVHMLTLTLPHDLPDRLSKLLAALHDGWSRIPRGAAWTRLSRRIGYLGYYYAEEITCKIEHGGSGWHPHVHVLIFTAAPLDARGIADLTLHARRQWVTGVTRAGLRPPSVLHGAVLQPNAGADDLARYIAKVQEKGWTAAHELARGDVKDGRTAGHLTPFGLLEHFADTGDAEYLDRWREYARATKGRPAIRSSRGLRARLGLAAAATDTVLAEAEVEEAGTVAVLAVPVWRRVLAARLESELLAAAESGGLAAINDLLSANGCGWANAPPGEGEP